MEAEQGHGIVYGESPAWQALIGEFEITWQGRPLWPPSDALRRRAISPRANQAAPRVTADTLECNFGEPGVRTVDAGIGGIWFSSGRKEKRWGLQEGDDEADGAIRSR